MIKKIWFINFILLFIPLFLLSQEETRINELKNVEIKPDAVVLTFNFEPEIKQFVLKAPLRSVVEVKNSVFTLPKPEIVPKEDNEYVKKVRIIQLSEEKIKIIRIITDLKKEIVPEVYTEENQVKIVLSKKEELKPHAEKKEKAPVVTKEKPVPVKSEEKTVRTEKPVSITAKEKEPAEKTKFMLPKTIVDLEVDNAEITDVLQLLAIKSGINIIYGPDVTGVISISLKKVPFDKAFESVLQLKKLTYVVISPNIIRVLTPATFEEERNQQIVYTKIFPLNYALATEVKTQIESIRAAEGRTKGMVSVDERTNSLIVTENEEGLKYIEEWIKKLDTKPFQVSIEAKLVDISLSDLKEMGVDWSFTNLQVTPGTELSYTTPERTTVDGTKISPRTGTGKEIDSGGVDIRVGYPTTGLIFQFGRITDALSLTAKLGLLITQGKAKVLSNPRVTTMSSKTAAIFAGEKVPYKTITFVPGPGGVTMPQESWSFLDAGISLSVKPTVSPDGWVTLEVAPNVSIPQPAPAPGAPPGVKTRTTNVTVMVKNNETLVIGGLITDTDLETINKIPVLADLPILGYLFKYKSVTKSRTELVILITPRIVEQ